MSLWDRVRGTRVETSAPEDRSAMPASPVDPDAPDLAAAIELAEFTPRQDGEYCCSERGLILRFTHATVVEADAAESEPAVGDFTNGARFSVQRRFGRPIVFTVLEPGDGDDGALVLRRTDTATREAGRLVYAFAADRD